MIGEDTEASHQHFRFRVRDGVEQALSRIGLEVEARVVLAGFDSGDDVPHRIFAKPDNGPKHHWLPSMEWDWPDEKPDVDPEQEIIHRYRHLRGPQSPMSWLRSRADDLAKALDESGAFEGFTFFASNAAFVGDYRVHTCIGVPTTELDSLPALDSLLIDLDCHYPVRSLPHAVIDECLRRSDRAICLPNLDEELRPLAATEDVVRAAAVRMIDAMVRRATEMPIDLFYAVDAFTSLSYEKAGAGGRLVIVDPSRPDIALRVRFQRPVSVHDARIMRKLLELSDDDTAVLASDEGYGLCAYGLGVCSPAPDVVEISILDRAQWELRIDGSAFVRVTYGHATLPRPSLRFDEFKDIAHRTVSAIDLGRIWPIIQEAQNSGHGTTIVVSDQPATEMDRLGSGAMPLEPELLKPAEVARLGRVDGAVLLGTDGRCYGFGIILDGVAEGSGDPARGSRFNSAVRYQTTMATGSLLVVISDDGTVDLVPGVRGGRRTTTI